MKQNKREEFDTWYAAELERNEQYVLWDKLNKYCHSDVICTAPEMIPTPK